MTTSWQDVSSERPQTTRCTPSTHTFSSIAVYELHAATPLTWQYPAEERGYVWIILLRRFVVIIPIAIKIQVLTETVSFMLIKLKKKKSENGELLKKKK